ncbi:polysaccharide deacetylase family protein [Paucibacter sp. B2R-40]|nr:polysaccharide deacetylase family protein [Paucibacter sp. B2R-40]MCV2354795.1 polysaccharide deacetylase family protein [Paucibacter sp. B2R-40]
MGAAAPGHPYAQTCAKPIFLTFDTGHMGVAPLIAETLKRFDARATFFLANEPTKTGGRTLDDDWAAWWRERLGEGHDFGAHTWNHDTWLADLPEPDKSEITRFKVSTAAGEQQPVRHEMSAEQYCASLKQVSARFSEMTGQAMGPIFRAPGGKTSPALLAAAQKCGYVHVGWSAAGFLGDELSSERYPNALLLERALKTVRPGDILMAHLGIWSRQQPWAPAVLEPLLQGLKDQGMCFAPLREHPRYRTLFKMAGLLQAAPASVAKDLPHD